MMLAALAILSFAAAFVVVRLILWRFSGIALDRPNERSLHERAVPRTGGIAVLAGAAVSLGFGAAGLWLPLALALGLALVSFADDVRGLPLAARLAAHLVAAAAFAWHLLWPLHPAALALVVLALVWLTNLYNFMDGADGMAAGMAVIGFGTYAAAAATAGNGALAAGSVALAAAAAAFLVHNFHPARLFLGDVGSIPLGFLAGALGLQGWRDAAWPLWFPLAAFAPFIADASFTLAKRVLRRQRFWEAHREHYYQRMVLAVGHRRTATLWYLAMLGCGIAALLLAR